MEVERSGTGTVKRLQASGSERLEGGERIDHWLFRKYRIKGIKKRDSECEEIHKGHCV